ncbi:zinc-binding alcohol dehydrogenase family protein [Pseudonocardia sp. WMMC193]|uniref:quinone oxidoreductase family protein n=1 Tax=Pseudonocardia sp. WMMC193 TaxID=2911965 RepID=UPI001F1AACA8|nr:zinc-binding alcohol dehydrogenase family protein [Pseudonocardia sp. WMMC193]MCF7551749.1 zinc-binding alcohol dehydrogenase family protein [Pseudonocardia sp. WMMC193]
MKAALVTDFTRPPRYAEVPAPTGPGVAVTVLAAGLHPRVRSQAAGTHYADRGELPLVPGLDGVGRDGEGVLRYFVLPDTPQGSMAESTMIDPRRSVALPDDADVAALAAGMNPAMSSWLALRRRIRFEPGASVLVLGAAGSAGRLAVQVARLLGAGRVTGAARRPERLADLRLDAVVDLAAADGSAWAEAGDVDVVLDYVWGAPASRAMVGLVTARSDRGRPLDWVQIGSVAGASAEVPSAALRASGLRIVGSGQGSVPTADIVGELPAIAAALSAGDLQVDADPRPLSEIERVWTEPADRRIVLTP